jgi:hypothetical membrane protein
VGAAVYVVCEAVAAARYPGYRYVDDYISDLGVYAIMNIGFIVHGALFLLGAIVVLRAYRDIGSAGWGFVLAAAANAIGNALAGAFRSGDHWHVIGAGLAIVGGNVAVVIAGIEGRRLGASRRYSRASIVIGAVGLACLTALIIDGANGSRVIPVGVLERGSVYSIIVWEIMTGVVLLRFTDARQERSRPIARQRVRRRRTVGRAEREVARDP